VPTGIANHCNGPPISPSSKPQPTNSRQSRSQLAAAARARAVNFENFKLELKAKAGREASVRLFAIGTPDRRVGKGVLEAHCSKVGGAMTWWEFG